MYNLALSVEATLTSFVTCAMVRRRIIWMIVRRAVTVKVSVLSGVSIAQVRVYNPDIWTGTLSSSLISIRVPRCLCLFVLTLIVFFCFVFC